MPKTPAERKAKPQRNTLTLIPRKGGRKEKPAPAHPVNEQEARPDGKAG